jgi:tripartite-type tricarboxylate transporter receptor subunit TctC
VVARAVGNQLSHDLGENFVVENRPGANGTIATNVVVQAAPDGYTLLYTSDSIAPTPFVYKSLPYDVFRDLAPIATSGVLDGLLMLVNPSSPAQTVDEFIAYAKSHRVLYGSPGVGNGLHLAAALFNKTAGLNMEHVPFKGASEVVAALLGNNIDVMFVTPPSVLGLIKDGKLRALAFTGTKPFPELPDVPLMKASVPDYPPVQAWGIFFGPAKTPPEIVDKLNAAIRHALREPAVANVVQKSGYVPDDRTPAQTAEFFRAKVEAAQQAVKAAGIEPN